MAELALFEMFLNSGQRTAAEWTYPVPGPTFQIAIRRQMRACEPSPKGAKDAHPDHQFPIYAGLCDNIAPSYAAVPGLVRKIWLANSATGTYGGVYVWRDKQAMEEFAETDLYKSVATHPNLKDFSSADFDVLLGPTEVTNGSI